jgi:hypothetical protein
VTSAACCAIVDPLAHGGVGGTGVLIEVVTADVELLDADASAAQDDDSTDSRLFVVEVDDELLNRLSR